MEITYQEMEIIIEALISPFEWAYGRETKKDIVRQLKLLYRLHKSNCKTIDELGISEREFKVIHACLKSYHNQIIRKRLTKKNIAKNISIINLYNATGQLKGSSCYIKHKICFVEKSSNG